jgi:hypothetical protein
MGWILSNWVERRAAREQNLKNAVDVWKKAQGAVAEACESLKQHYGDLASIRRTKQNGHSVIITITRRLPPEMQRGETLTPRVVAMKFESDTRKITVTVDHETEREYPIEADPDHAFLSLKGRELLLDEFSRLALEDVFFSQPEPALSPRRLRIVR